MGAFFMRMVSVAKGNKTVRGDTQWLADYLRRNPAAASEQTEQVLKGSLPLSPTAQALLDIGLGDRQRSHRAERTSKPKKSQGLSTKKSYLPLLIESVSQAQVRSRLVRFEDGTFQELVLWFEGARALTINQMISIFHNRQFQYFRYKKRWQAKVKEALDPMRSPGQPWPGFVHPVRIEILRHAARLVDRDALPTMFKILIDALRAPDNGIIRDDNPNEVVDLVPYQQKIMKASGDHPGIGLRLIALPGWVPPAPPALDDWLRTSVCPSGPAGAS